MSMHTVLYSSHGGVSVASVWEILWHSVVEVLSVPQTVVFVCHCLQCCVPFILAGGERYWRQE